MKYRFAAITILLLAASCAAPRVFPPEATVTDRAVDMATNLCTGNSDTAAGQFSLLLKILVTPQQIGLIYKTLIVPLGEFKSVESVTTNIQNGKTVVKVSCRIGDSVQDILVVYDSRLKVAGLRFLPTHRSIDYTAPSYVDTSKFFDMDIRFGLPDWKLSGSLSLPMNNEPYPVVIILHGSGPVDRDGTVGAQMPYRDLAWGLASRGIAVIRYDKRSYLYPEKLMSLTNFTLWDESVEDAVEAVKFALSIPGVDPSRIFVIGHSLGATAAIRLVATNDNLRGCILMAGTPRPLEQLMAIQTLYIATNDGKYTFNERLQVAIINRQCRAASEGHIRPDTSARKLPSGVPAPYWIDLHRDVLPDSLGNTVPLLVLQGERDYQVTMTDFGIWKEKFAGCPNVRFESFIALNHLFSAGDRQGLSVPEEYNLTNHVAVEIIDAIEKFIEDNR